jgi:hypothetical protein
MARSPVATQAPAGRSIQLSGELVVNLYAEPAPPGARVELVLRNAPGLKPFASGMGAGPIRATIEALGYAWVVSGGTVYFMDSAGTVTACSGTSIDTTGWVCMASDGLTVTITANRNGYVVSAAKATGTLTLTNQAQNNETVVIGSVTYTWKTTLTASAYEVLRSGSASGDIDNLVAAINRTGASGTSYSEATTRHPTVSAAAGAGDTMVVTALESGADGNSIITTETMSNGSWGGPTLSNGANFTVTGITDPAFATGATSVAFCDGYMIFSRPDSGQWFISGLYDATSFDALDFATAEGSPDNLVRIFVDHREVIALGNRTIEVYSNQGGADFPFVRVEGAFIERGCIAVASVAKMDNGVFFIGDDRMVYRLQGYTPARISTSAVEEVLRDAADIADAEGWTYVLAGHHCYVLTLPTTEVTLVYDAQTNLWHQMRSGTEQTGRWRAQWAFLAFGKSLVGDSLDGNVYELDIDTYAENGEQRRWVARTPTMYADGKLARSNLIELECELGVGIGSGQGSNPTVMMRTSDDGGHTWSPERTGSMGAQGVTKRRHVRWRRNGSFEQRIIEFSGADPVKTTLFGMIHEGGAP